MQPQNPTGPVSRKGESLSMRVFAAAIAWPIKNMGPLSQMPDTVPDIPKGLGELFRDKKQEKGDQLTMLTQVRNREHFSPRAFSYRDF